MNRVELTATVIEVPALRYTPAGVPVVELLLQHESEVEQAGKLRRISFQTKAIALGDIAHLLVDIPLGATLKAEGFLAATRMGSSKLVLHIQRAERLYPGSGSAVV